jgi:2-keto-4-pentenoate hydratase/2-oxohepta-3-ene-1,7-dioic acid hydratase in catechol pathway
MSVRAYELLLVSYRRRPDEPPRTGIAQGEHIIPLASLTGFTDDILQACERATEAVERLSELANSSEGLMEHSAAALADVQLCPPVANPEKIICLGLNYRDHASEAGFEPPPVPIFFSKFRNALAGPFDPIVLPEISQQVDFEGELAVVIGTPGKHIAVDDALAHVAGHAVMNDVSARDLQLQTSQWIAGKTLDTFAPLGPGIVSSSLIPDPQDLRLETRVNGTVVQSDSTASMVFGVAETIAFLSSIMTLRPGDIIATGTPAGVGFKREPPMYLQAGDVVEVEIEGVGTIQNPVVRDSQHRTVRLGDTQAGDIGRARGAAHVREMPTHD